MSNFIRRHYINHGNVLTDADSRDFAIPYFNGSIMNKKKKNFKDSIIL